MSDTEEQKLRAQLKLLVNKGRGSGKYTKGEISECIDVMKDEAEEALKKITEDLKEEKEEGKSKLKRKEEEEEEEGDKIEKIEEIEVVKKEEELDRKRPGVTAYWDKVRQLREEKGITTKEARAILKKEKAEGKVTYKPGKKRERTEDVTEIEEVKLTPMQKYWQRVRAVAKAEDISIKEAKAILKKRREEKIEDKSMTRRGTNRKRKPSKWEQFVKEAPSKFGKELDDMDLGERMSFLSKMYKGEKAESEDSS